MLCLVIFVELMRMLLILRAVDFRLNAARAAGLKDLPSLDTRNESGLMSCLKGSGAFGLILLARGALQVSILLPNSDGPLN
jgi:hypothetical protein|tara:strand:- start:541 stop:783 length:243 start_codon:yes stop_codon:yes gene_type:complete